MCMENFHKQRAQCQKKVKLQQADAERKAFWRGMRSYQCPICRGWHLTTKDAPLYPR